MIEGQCCGGLRHWQRRNGTCVAVGVFLRQTQRVNASPARRPPVQPVTWIAPTQRAVFEAAGTTAHRIASGSDGWAERLGDDAMISHKNDAVLAELGPDGQTQLLGAVSAPFAPPLLKQLT
jgi:hypothetical protein